MQHWVWRALGFLNRGVRGSDLGFRPIALGIGLEMGRDQLGGYC